MTQKDAFKKCFVIGLILFFISLFLEWYSFQLYDLSHKVIVSGHFSMVFGWSITTTQPNTLANLNRQYDIPELFFIALISIVLILVTMYEVLFKDIDTHNKNDGILLSSWTTICVWALLILYFFIVPFLFFIPKDLYFPFAYYEDGQTHSSHFCGVGPGYIAQIIAFILTTPYAAFHYQTIRRFEKEEKTLEKVILHTQEPLDLDKLLAEEEVTLKS